MIIIGNKESYGCTSSHKLTTNSNNLNKKTMLEEDKKIQYPLFHVKTIWDWHQRWNVIPNGRRIKRKNKR